jgi:hypothetical protein
VQLSLQSNADETTLGEQSEIESVDYHDDELINLRKIEYFALSMNDSTSRESR